MVIVISKLKFRFLNHTVLLEHVNSQFSLTSHNERLYQSPMPAKGNNQRYVASVSQDYISCIEPDAWRWGR
jgi:hypothetical protein